MANIQSYLDQIANAVYGEEIRSSIINSLQKVNDDNDSYADLKKEVIAARDDINDQVDQFDKKMEVASEISKKLEEDTASGNQTHSDLTNSITTAQSERSKLESAYENVGKVVESANEKKDALDASLSSANTAKTNLDGSVTTATTTEKSLDETIQTSEQRKKNLDSSITSANKIFSNLNDAITSANNAKSNLTQVTDSADSAKTALDESTETAGTVQETLSATVNQAGALDTSLGEKIETGTQLKTDLVTSGEKAVQDIQAAGSEQLGKMQAVAEAFTADREQIATNKEDIGSLKEDISNKITKFYASNQGETHLADSDNGKIMDMMLYGRSEQKLYKGINLLPPNIEYNKFIEVSIPKGTKIFMIMDGIKTNGGNFRFFNADKTENMWFGIDKGVTVATTISRFDVKYVQNLIKLNSDLPKMCLGIGDKPIYEPYVGGQPSPSPDYPQEIKSVVNPTVKITNKDGLKVQSVTLNNITLNAIPVSSGGNVTVGGQQYVSDYVDVERGKLVRMCKYKKLLSADIKKLATSGKVMYVETDEIWDAEGNYTSRKFDMLYSAGRARLITVADSGWDGKGEIVIENVKFTHIDEAKNYFDNNDVYACYPIPTPEEIPITLEEVSTFKQLLTYYPVTNISVSSKQLDGYTVFNYPISMANGWNYVKQQLGDTRDYIYDMDAKAQDIDIQSAEAYVNSEYAVALTELEVM